MTHLSVGRCIVGGWARWLGRGRGEEKEKKEEKKEKENTETDQASFLQPGKRPVASMVPMACHIGCNDPGAASDKLRQICALQDGPVHAP
jgi:hypothetical protein